MLLNMSNDDRKMALENIIDPSDLPLLDLVELLSEDPQLLQNPKIHRKIINILDLISKISDVCKDSHSANIALRKTCIEIIGTLNLKKTFGNIPAISTDRLTALLYGLTGLTPYLCQTESHLTYQDPAIHNEDDSTQVDSVGDR